MLKAVTDASSILGDVATAVAVGFAAYQLWLLNKSTRVESHLNLIQAERDIWLTALTTPDMATTVEEVWGVSSPQNAKTNLFWGIFLDSCEHMYLRHRAGIMSDEAWSSMESYIGRLIQAPSFRIAWLDIQGDYVRDFGTYLSFRLEQTQTTPLARPS